VTQQVRALATRHRGVLMRSRLEAHWATVLDTAGIAWSYEPELIRLPGRGRRWTGYVPDFWLPELQTWLEVKGPHWERFDKTRALARLCGKPGLVLVATAAGVCWQVPHDGRKPSMAEAGIGDCGCGKTALGIPVRTQAGRDRRANPERWAVSCRFCGKMTRLTRTFGW
jgi:hypothetical protein